MPTEEEIRLLASGGIELPPEFWRIKEEVSPPPVIDETPPPEPPPPPPEELPPGFPIPEEQAMLSSGGIELPPELYELPEPTTTPTETEPSLSPTQVTVDESQLMVGPQAGKEHADQGLVELVESGASVAEIQAYLNEHPEAARGSYAWGIQSQIDQAIAAYVESIQPTIDALLAAATDQLQIDILTALKQGRYAGNEEAIIAVFSSEALPYVTFEGSYKGFTYSVDIVAAVEAGVPKDAIVALGIPLEVIDQTIALDALEPYKQPDGSYDLVSAIEDGLIEYARTPGLFDPMVIVQAQLASGTRATWERAHAQVVDYIREDGTLDLEAAVAGGVPEHVIRLAGFDITSGQYEAAGKLIQLDSGEWVDADAFNSLPPEHQEILNSQGFDAYEAWIAETTVELSTGELVDRDAFEELNSYQQDFLMENGVDAFDAEMDRLQKQYWSMVEPPESPLLTSMTAPWSADIVQGLKEGTVTEQDLLMMGYEPIQVEEAVVRAGFGPEVYIPIVGPAIVQAQVGKFQPTWEQALGWTQVGLEAAVFGLPMLGWPGKVGTATREAAVAESTALRQAGWRAIAAGDYFTGEELLLRANQTLNPRLLTRVGTGINNLIYGGETFVTAPVQLLRGVTRPGELLSGIVDVTTFPLRHPWQTAQGIFWVSTGKVSLGEPLIFRAARLILPTRAYPTYAVAVPVRTGVMRTPGPIKGIGVTQEAMQEYAKAIRAFRLETPWGTTLEYPVPPYQRLTGGRLIHATPMTARWRGLMGEIGEGGLFTSPALSEHWTQMSAAGFRGVSKGGLVFWGREPFYFGEPATIRPGQLGGPFRWLGRYGGTVELEAIWGPGTKIGVSTQPEAFLRVYGQRVRLYSARVGYSIPEIPKVSLVQRYRIKLSGLWEAVKSPYNIRKWPMGVRTVQGAVYADAASMGYEEGLSYIRSMASVMPLGFEEGYLGYYMGYYAPALVAPYFSYAFRPSYTALQVAPISGAIPAEQETISRIQRLSYSPEGLRYALAPMTRGYAPTRETISIIGGPAKVVPGIEGRVESTEAGVVTMRAISEGVRATPEEIPPTDRIVPPEEEEFIRGEELPLEEIIPPTEGPPPTEERLIRKEERPVPPPPRGGEGGEPERYLPKGTLYWVQGALGRGRNKKNQYKILRPPYDVSRMESTLGPRYGLPGFPIGVTPQQSVGIVGGPVPYDIDVDLGVTDIFVKAGMDKPTMFFEGGGLRTDVGKRMPSTTRGITVRPSGRGTPVGATIA